MTKRANTLEPKDQPIPCERPSIPAGELGSRRSRPHDPGRPPRVRRLGRVRVPVAGGHRPWATAYRLPDGRTIWCLRLWEVDRAVRHCASPETLGAYCEASGMPRVAEAIRRIGGR